VAIALLLESAACTTQMTPQPTESAAEAPPATVSPTASATPTPSLTPIVAGDWERVPDQPSLRSLQLSQVVWTGERFVAGSTGGHFLDSVDGRTWNLQRRSWPVAAVNGMASSTRAIVAVGRIDDRAASWYSSDGGLTWTISPDEASLHAAPGSRISMNDVTKSDDGWVAVGEEDEACELMCPTAARAVVWASADGIHWTQQAASQSLANAGMYGVSRSGAGFVAVGRSVPIPTAAMVWTSEDGGSWSKVADEPIFHPPSGTDQTFGAFMHAVTTGTDGILVAVGQVGTQGAVGSALVWWSADGQTWHAASGERFLFGQLLNVASVPTGFLATGPSGAESCLGGIWSSTDGRSWRCVAGDPAFADCTAYAAAASTDIEVVVGSGPPSSDGSAWVRTLR
jgi:hypothetical protein